MKLSIILIAVLFTTSIALAQSDSLKKSPVKSLTDQQYDAYLKGEDINKLGLVGSLNHFPAPGAALKYKSEIQLSPTQLININNIDKELTRKKIEMGKFIIKNEMMLDSMFRTRKLTDGTVIFYTNRYGIYIGELRNAILQANIKTEKLLSASQIKKLEALVAHN